MTFTDMVWGSCLQSKISKIESTDSLFPGKVVTMFDSESGINGAFAGL
jgi:hypothetical protein